VNMETSQPMSTFETFSSSFQPILISFEEIVDFFLDKIQPLLQRFANELILSSAFEKLEEHDRGSRELLPLLNATGAGSSLKIPSGLGKKREMHAGFAAFNLGRILPDLVGRES